MFFLSSNSLFYRRALAQIEHISKLFMVHARFFYRSFSYNLKSYIRYSRQYFALHYVTYTDMKRVAFTQIDIRQDKIILETAYALAQDISLVVRQSAPQGIGNGSVSGYHRLLDNNAETSKRKRTGSTHAHFEAVTAG